MFTAFIQGVMAAAVLQFIASFGGSFLAARYAQFAAAMCMCLTLVNGIKTLPPFTGGKCTEVVIGSELCADYSAVNEIIKNQVQTLLSENGYPYSDIEATYSADEGLKLCIWGCEAALQRQMSSVLAQQFHGCTVYFY